MVKRWTAVGHAMERAELMAASDGGTSTDPDRKRNTHVVVTKRQVIAHMDKQKKTKLDGLSESSSNQT